MREICNAEWDDIQDRLKEKDAEIERLKKELAFQTDMACQADVACMRLKSLIARAADALDYSSDRSFHVHLIAELRKAAQ